MSYTIAHALKWAKESLSPDDLRDAEVLLQHVLKISRSYLLAHADRLLSANEFTSFEKLILQRKAGVPVAYLTGHREFWSLDFVVTPDVLIPRPETEILVAQVLEKIADEKKLIADLGVGSGAIALAIAHERPHCEIHATDKSAAALAIAKLNAEHLQIKNVFFHQGEWCAALPDSKFHCIVSNPPYIAHDDTHIETNTANYEPHEALFSAEDGLHDIRQIIFAARDYLLPEGWLMLEHGFQQAAAVRKLFAEAGYVNIETFNDLAGLERVTAAQQNV